eukprot:CAMPEP_0177696926 /NCGR_PEP_ID=MMETSP0484_2-20121128/4240_1 /TAXON_ID=354590 /ORGANISM="Rhodomonas lens, Strain RHODO" /LENGTH=137 /DNA_ID=CAMNT_0019207929 /DNA_START=692 /DNA_END=1102 /DNA_ORIENTATION=-
MWFAAAMDEMFMTRFTPASMQALSSVSRWEVNCMCSASPHTSDARAPSTSVSTLPFTSSAILKTAASSVKSSSQNSTLLLFSLKILLSSSEDNTGSLHLGFFRPAMNNLLFNVTSSMQVRARAEVPPTHNTPSCSCP